MSDSNDDNEIKEGSRVRSHVWNSIEQRMQPMHSGIVVAIRGGIADVDRMSLHGGAPWVVSEYISHLKLETVDKPAT